MLNQQKAVHVFIHQDRQFYFARIWDLSLFTKSAAEMPFFVNLFVNYRKNNLDLWFSSFKTRCKEDSVLFSSTSKHIIELNYRKQHGLAKKNSLVKLSILAQDGQTFLQPPNIAVYPLSSYGWSRQVFIFWIETFFILTLFLLKVSLMFTYVYQSLLEPNLDFFKCYSAPLVEFSVSILTGHAASVYLPLAYQYKV